MPNLRYLHIGVLVSLCLEAASPWQAWPVPPRDVMADITNDLGICLLQVIGGESRENIAFSPYGVMSIVFLLYEGSHGNTAIEIYNSLRLPWDRHMSRIGFRDLHRHIKSYFSNDRFLRGLVLSKPSVPLKSEYVRLLNFYGFYPNKDGEPQAIPNVPPAHSEGKGRPEDHTHAAAPPTYVPAKETTKRPTYTTIRPTSTIPPIENEYETKPTIHEYETKPTINEFETKPTTNEYVTKPYTNDYTTKPYTKDYTTKSYTNDYTTKSYTKDYTTKSYTNDYTTKSYTNDYTTKPYTNEYMTTKPSTSVYGKKPTTKEYGTKPTTNYPTTHYSGGNSYETEPTIPPYDPTKYPSKTTNSYTTSKKSMRKTTTTQSYTFDDLSTVKPGYNSHGMTQFFTDRTPTAPGEHHTGSDYDQPTIEDNIIFGEEHHQNGHQRPTMQPATDSGIYSPPKHGFTDPFSTEPNRYSTSKWVTTMKSTTPPYTGDEENELPVYFPNGKTNVPPKSTTESYGQGETSYDKTTSPPTPSEEDPVVYPTDSTSETDDDYNGIDIRSGKVKHTSPSPFETTERNINPSETLNTKGRSNDDITPFTSNKVASKTEPVTQKTAAAESTTQPPTNQAETILEVETTKSITDYQEKNAKIMTQKEVELANRIVESLNKTVTEAPETASSSLATILMSVGYSNNSTTKSDDLVTESSLKSDQTEKTTTSNEETTSRSLNTVTTDKPVDSQQTEVTTDEIPTTAESTKETSKVLPTATVVQNQTQIHGNGTENRQTNVRKKRSLIGPPNTYDHRDGSNNWIPAAEGPHWEYNVPRDQWFFTYSGSEPVPILTYMDYLPFAFIESINTLALQLPLDDPRYSMLILLPMERFGLDQLLASLHQCSIREILKDLRVIPVYAVLPAFTLVKHINLVPALNQMGIEEVFDPSRADLSGMASEPHLFVRSIEQLVTVSLRKYHYSSRKFDGRPEEIRHHFIANHPFLYFVLDSETDAALMAGTIVNPTAYKQRDSK